ncbi:MAG: hypothetical protein KC910_27080 [Candidatus Eremiobacteraeota bacterium]|nr:hypothetical protein [Candidatus Eremiobacteraeota bacterium]
MPAIIGLIILLLLGLPAGADGLQEPTLAVPHPHGKTMCSSGCALSNHPTPPLSREHFHELLAAFAGEPMSEESPALEELLYYGRQSRRLLEAEGPGPLDVDRERFLRRELRREFATVEFRIIDERDVVRVWMEPMRVPLDIRHVFYPLKVKDFQSPEASGTVKRVGLHHLWQRI